MTNHLSRVLVALRGGPMDGRVVETFAGTTLVTIAPATAWPLRDPSKAHHYRVVVQGDQIIEALYEETR